MTLRSKLLLLFGALAVAPLVALGGFEFVRAERAVRDLLRVQTTSIATRIAARSSDRVDALRSNLALLARNAEVQRALRDRAGVPSAVAFVDTAARAMGGGFGTLVYADSAGTEVMRVATGGGGTGRRQPLTLPIADDARSLGSMTTFLSVADFIPSPLLDSRVGLTGYTALVDRNSREVVMGTAPTSGIERALSAADSAGAESDSVIIVRYSDNDTTRVAAIAPLRSSALAVVASASIPEFAAPMRSARAADFALALAVAFAMALAFTLVSRRVTRPLETLTSAAGEVGRGNFSPDLPSETSDEVGQLAAAFRIMSGKISDMLHQLESSRQMAAVGAFAAQISHEIRNPLTSIKLNLQSMERLVSRDPSSPLARPLAISLREIQRLDGVVRGVLKLGREQRVGGERVSAHDVIRASQELTRAQLDAQGIRLEIELGARSDVIAGNAEALRGVLLNLILNAADALPGGGRIRLATSNPADAPNLIRITIADDGPGVAAGDRDHVFDAFFTTKPGGSGLGLALAARDVETHRGRLSLSPAPAELGGAEFTIELPLAEPEPA